MNTQQVVSLVVVGAILCWMYLPNLTEVLKQVKPSMPTITPKKPELLDQIADIVAIREASSSPEVTKACNALLEVLLQVK
jgi:hypothetical protein